MQSAGQNERQKAMGRQRITSADVARASGVSRATVSYVLNNDPRQTIPEPTRERVLAAARQLGYSPFAPARALHDGQSHLVLAVIPFEQIDPRLSLRIKEMEAGLAAQGLTLVCSIGQHLQTGPTHPSTNITPCVVLSYADEENTALTPFLEQFHAPILYMGNRSIRQQLGYLQAAYLLQHYKRPLIYILPEREDVQSIALLRLDGVRQACRDRGVAGPDTSTLPSSLPEARRCIREYLTRLARPWSICCYNDEVAFAVLAALYYEHIAIPEEAAVIGCDDIPLAQFSIPALTTVAFEDTFDSEIAAIVALSKGESSDYNFKQEATVVVRASA